MSTERMREGALATGFIRIILSAYWRFRGLKICANLWRILLTIIPTDFFWFFSKL
jgi:hypothetical protein